MIQFDGGISHRAEPITLEDIQETLRYISNTDVSLSALHMATTWTDRARQATNYRNGRVFLAGDAAHIHSPLGGQGLNLGLGDAMNLGWKLAATIQGNTPDHLLDSYYTERYPIGQHVLDWSRAQVAIMDPSPKSRALNAIMSDLMNTRDGATYIAGRVWGIHTHYDLGSEHPLMGHSIPNFELEGGSDVGKRMHDGRGILLDFDSNPLLKAWANEYHEQIHYISDKAKDQLGLSALLVRPDGFIAWASDDEPDEALFRQAADLWFVR